MKTETYTLPAYWASALINGDYSGTSSGDEEDIKIFYARHPHLGFCLSCENESEFVSRNDFNNIGGAVADFTFPVLPRRTDSERIGT